jgi:TctA family transporter
MADAAAALGLLLEPARLAALFVGMFVGMIVGMLPGLGGVAAVSMLLPFVYLLDQYSGLAMLLGAISIVYTSDTITSVLVGAPGSPASAPTAIEGHALAKQGQAARALSVGFLASMVGGIVGAVVLTIAIPIAGPIVLSLGTAELFMFACVGLYYASSLMGGNVVRGVLVACFGLAMGIIGPAPAAAEFRFTFGQAYLLDGISLTIVALGLFGVAEVLSMLAEGGGISRTRVVLTDWGAGAADAWRHRWLILRGSIIGVLGGFVPAVGASASTWVAYAHAVRTTKDKSRFGKGEIRGIAAAEGANNATIIADLVPTMLFSVPGGPAAAIFMGALYSFGHYPGPRFVNDNPDLMYLIIWSVAIASVVGAMICFAVTPWLARLTQIRFALVAAPLMLVMIIGAYQATNSIGDIAMLLLLGLIGWMMKRGGWPRAPALVGFVLAKPMEQYFWLANQLFGWKWLLRPGVLIIGALILVPVVIQLVRWVRRRAKGELREGQAASDAESAATARGKLAEGRVSTTLSLFMLGVFAYALVEARTFLPQAQALPLFAIIPGVALAALAFGRDLWAGHWFKRAATVAAESGDSRSVVREELLQYLVLVGYAAAIWFVGFYLATPAYLAWVLIARAKMRVHNALIYGAALIGAIYALIVLLHSPPPSGMLFGQ